MANSPNILRIAIPRPLYQLLDYLPVQGKGGSEAASGNEDSPTILQSAPQPAIPKIGSRVRVPFGHTELTGVIVDIVDESPFAELKEILTVLDSEPLLDKPMLKLLLWASRYYHHPVGDVVTHALPLALRGQRKIPKSPLWTTTSLADNTTVDALSRAPKQLTVFGVINDSDHGINEAMLVQQFGNGTKTLLRQLVKKSLIETLQAEFHPTYPIYENKKHKNKKKIEHQNKTKNENESATKPHEKKPSINLTDEQKYCVEQIKEARPYLLHGVTGSGKTEVYLRTIEPLINKNKQILIIVPEIGLTPQLLSRFIDFFSVNSEHDHKQEQEEKHIAVMHSGLADGERMQTWLAAKYGKLDILIGTRSSLFVPMPRLGMIIIDEEHDSSLKQQEGFRYHARDLAIKRAYDLKIPIILGSATPSLESLHNSDRNRYRYLRLNKRPGVSVQPDVQVRDIRGLPLESGVCPPLLSAVREHIDAGNQVMLFLNRRGFAPTMLCPKCGWHAQCKACEANMTYHAKTQKLICHRCDFERSVDHRCPDCGNTHITTKGQGTERIEQKLQAHFPNTDIVRIDRDTTRRKGELQKKLDTINKGKPAILIGTQMLAKGHDFPNLTLVGILDVDQSLFSTDFRAWERLSQLIIQVSGRAGRAEKKGTVVLQTTQPDHPFFQILLSQGYLAIARQSLTERKNWHFPPHAYQALLRANAPKQEHAINYLKQVKTLLEPYQSDALNLLGPAPSPIEKRANRFRSQLLITATQRKLLHQALSLLSSDSNKIRKTGGVRWSVDVDPIDYV